MTIRKFIEEMGEKILPARRGNVFRATRQQEQSAGGPSGQQGDRASSAGNAAFGTAFTAMNDVECAEAIRRHIQSRRGFVAPSDLVVFFNADDGVAVLGGTVRDDETRELVVRTAGNIQGVEIVDDRMMLAPAASWR